MSVFFFFKRKTAYDMRISDWSSDVCSSDLILGMQINQPRKSEFIKIASEDDVASKGARYACGIGVEVGLAIAARRKMCQDDLLDLGLGGNFADLLTRQMVGYQMLHQQIGRASGRERVCQ